MDTEGYLVGGGEVGLGGAGTRRPENGSLAGVAGRVDGADTGFGAGGT